MSHSKLFSEPGKDGYFVTETGGIGQCFSIQTIDQESNSFPELEQGLKYLISKMQPGFAYKFYLNASNKKDFSDLPSRQKDIEKIGAKVVEAYLVVHEVPNFLDQARNLLRAFQGQPAVSFKRLNSAIEALGVKDSLAGEPIQPDDLNKLILKEPAVSFITKPPLLDFGSSFKSVIQMRKTEPGALTFESISEHLATLPAPFTICATFAPTSKEMSEALARAKLGRFTNGIISGSTLEDMAEDVLHKVTIEGQRLFNFDLSILIERESESELRLATVEFENYLSIFGTPQKAAYNIEHLYGGFRVESLPDCFLSEIEEAMPVFLPLVRPGQSSHQYNLDDLLVHRMDESLDRFNVFDPSYSNYSVCIFGKSGSGKSVLTNLLTKSLLNSPENRIIKVDVGGSHSKETKLLGGEEYRLSIDRPSGINPFRSAVESSNIDASVGVLCSFLAVLILENGEIDLSKEMKSGLEQSLKAYLESSPMNPSLSDFLASSGNIPRKEVLERWGRRGVYKNAFTDSENTQTTLTQLRYFNFSEIFQASDPDYGQGGLAAIMALFNFEMMKSDGKRLIFIADETPFFIKRCFPFFKFSTANVRKFGGSFITIAQNSSDVVVGNDTGIIDNSNSRFLFSVDGSTNGFCERLNLSVDQSDRVRDLRRVPGAFSEVFVDDGQSKRVLRLRLSPEEYWSMTSSHDDKMLLDRLKGEMPTLSEQEIIRCLSASF